MVMGSALDILEAGRPPRATFIDYPLGHPVGRPFDSVDQLAIVREGLRGFETMLPATRIQTLAHCWDADSRWQHETESADVSDTRQPRDESPQFQFGEDRLAAVASGALLET